jgi:hypothetical protein
VKSRSSGVQIIVYADPNKKSHIPMQTDGIPDIPISPNVGVLPQGPVSGTRNVGENAIKDATPLARTAKRLERRISGSVKVGDHHTGASYAVQRLMDKHVAALIVRVVRNEEAGWVCGRSMNSLEQLRGLGTGSGTHVENLITKLNQIQTGEMYANIRDDAVVHPREAAGPSTLLPAARYCRLLSRTPRNSGT